MKKILYIILLIIILVACNGPSQTKKTMKTEDKSNSKQLQIDAKTPEYKAFLNQEHRFELNGCELKYNDNPFKLGMTLQEFEDVFGKCDKENIITSRNEKDMLWINKDIIVTFYNNKAIYIYIYMKTDVYETYDDDDYKATIKGVYSVMYNGHILKKNENFQEFFKKAKMNIDDNFIIDSNGYEDIKYCKDKEIRLYLSSSVIYERKGNGHLYIKGKWKMEETNPIEAISLSYHIK